MSQLLPTVTDMSTMTRTRQTGPPVLDGRAAQPSPRARLVDGRLALLLLASFGALTSFYLLLSVTPMFAVSAGAGSAAAGAVTGSLMLATVLAEFASAALMNRYGYRVVFAAGTLLLGGPALALLAPRSLGLILAVSIARGLGFGLSTVVVGALVATAVPLERRGEGIGLAGVVACVPAVVALPSGVWLAASTSDAVVIVIAAAAALAPLAMLPWLAAPAGNQTGNQTGSRAATGEGTPPPGLRASLRSGGQRRPALIFAATTVSAGVVAAFLPLASGVSAGTAAAGLFTQALTAAAGRWWAGRYGDRRGSAGPHGHAGLLIPGLFIAAAGMTTLLWVAAPAAVIAGMALFGIGFGIAQTVTFTLMIDRAPVSGYGTVSALWNLAYDAGYGAGPALFGVFAARTGYPAAFAITGMLIFAALLPAARDRAPARGNPQRAHRGSRRPA